MFRNLIDNARSFSALSPAAPPEVRVSLQKAGRQATAVVEDDGPGLPPENLETVFERFYTARPKGAAFGGHSGLGLSIARQIVEAHGGQIRAENRTNGDGRVLGARFVVTPAGETRGVIRHAGLIARFDPPVWRGVLIEGPSGAGKSDLAMRALDAGWALVADDRTLIWTCGERLYGRAPDALAGLLEVRGLGVLTTPGRSFAQVVLVASCSPPQAIERIPDGDSEILLEIQVPRFKLAAFEPSALAKLRRAINPP